MIKRAVNRDAAVSCMTVVIRYTDLQKRFDIQYNLFYKEWNGLTWVPEWMSIELER